MRREPTRGERYRAAVRKTGPTAVFRELEFDLDESRSGRSARWRAPQEHRVISYQQKRLMRRLWAETRREYMGEWPVEAP